ncbi:MAG: recombinase family protein, partial [Alphaproteobacteria bacterium]|nr:recombinase family protein [Alphaproteobacteria bacterium]
MKLANDTIQDEKPPPMVQSQDVDKIIWNALIYCRVSSKKQLKGSGLDSQEHRCRQHAKLRRYPVEATFLDNVSGGLDLIERPAMQDLFHYLDTHANSNKRYIVIFDDHKRFARQTEVHLKLRRELDAHGVRVEYLNFTIEDSPEGTFIDTMLAAQSQLEREQIGRQTKQKTKARLEKGFWTFRAPVGYKYVQSKYGGKNLVKDEPLAGIVKEALEGFASGRFVTQTEMKRFLEANPHYPKDMPNGEIRAQTIIRLMSKVLYAGYVEAPSFNVSRRKGKHEGLISLETFEKIQTRRNENAYVPARKDIHKDFILRGAVVCGSCNSPLTAGWSKGKYKKYPYYFCRKKGCTEYGKTVPRAKLEEDFENILKELQPTKGLFQIAFAMFKDAWNAQMQKTVSIAKTFKQDAFKVEKEIGQLIKHVMDTTSPRVIQAYEDRIDELEKKKLIYQEKAGKTDMPKHSFEEMFEL